MLVNLNEIFEYANKHEVAIGAFNIPTLEMMKAVIEAAEEVNCPIIIQHTEGHSDFISMEEVIGIGKYYAMNASIPVCIHLDHGATYATCKKAIDLGFTSVMFDGSLKSYEENVQTTQKVVQYARKHDVTVEAELGFMLNSEVGAGEGVGESDDTYEYTDPNQAEDFYEKTRVDCLAIAAGTVHGLYLNKPKLNLNVIKEIENRIKIPLVLHGGSGLKDIEYKEAIKNGIRKINYYTYMNKAGGESIQDYLSKKNKYIFFDELSLIAKNAMKANVLSFLKVLNRK